MMPVAGGSTMAHEDFIKLVEKVLDDPDFRTRVGTIEDGSVDDMMSELIAIAADAGLRFTTEEVDELFLMQVTEDAKDPYTTVELTEEELGMIAGGTSASLGDAFTLQYVRLQNKVSSENRAFTLMSNIMKTKHESAKHAINNIR